LTYRLRPKIVRRSSLAASRTVTGAVDGGDLDDMKATQAFSAGSIKLERIRSSCN